jgi:hypothetical protein
VFIPFCSPLVQLAHLESLTENDYGMPKAKSFLAKEENRRLAPAELHPAGEWDELAVFRAVQQLLFKCGCPDFCLADWIKPDKARAVRHLSAVVAFALYHRSQAPIFDDHLEKKVRSLAPSLPPSALPFVPTLTLVSHAAIRNHYEDR